MRRVGRPPRAARAPPAGAGGIRLRKFDDMSDHAYARVIQKHSAFPQRTEVGNAREQMGGHHTPLTKRVG
jgi:hypothetical protein